MARRIGRTVCVLLLFFAARDVRAGPEQTKPPRPFERFRTLCAELPVPDPARAFRFDGAVSYRGYPVGRVSLEARPERVDGALGWKCRERWQRGLDRKRAWISTTTTYLTRTLEFVRGHSISQREGESWHLDWRAVAGGLRVTLRGPERMQPMEPRTVKHEGPLLVGLAGQVLLMRMMPPPRKPLHVPLGRLDRPPPATGAIRDETIGMGRRERWRSLDALFVPMGKAENGFDTEFVLDPRDRSLRAIRSQKDGRTLHEILPRGETKELAPAAVLEDPPRTPQAAAMQAVLVLRNKDEELFDRLMHWPSVLAWRKTLRPGHDEDEEAVRSNYLDEFRKRKPWGQFEPVTLEALLRGIIHDVKVKKDGEDKATVFMPEEMGSWPLYVGRFDGIWYLLRPPGADR